MAEKVVFLHTVSSLVPLFTELCNELLPPDVEIYHIADEILARIVVAQGELSPFIYRRTVEHVVAAREAGAIMVQATCSSISPCVEASRLFVDIPVLKIDEAMVRKAVQMSERIGIIATAPTTLKPTGQLARQVAVEYGRKVEIIPVLCEGAYPALVNNNMELHDQIVLKYLRQLMADVDLVLLAQASMARVIDRFPADEQKVPILSSPRLAVMHVAEVLAQINRMDKNHPLVKDPKERGI